MVNKPHGKVNSWRLSLFMFISSWLEVKTVPTVKLYVHPRHILTLFHTNYTYTTSFVWKYVILVKKRTSCTHSVLWHNSLGQKMYFPKLNSQSHQPEEHREGRIILWNGNTGDYCSRRLETRTRVSLFYRSVVSSLGSQLNLGSETFWCWLARRYEKMCRKKKKERNNKWK